MKDIRYKESMDNGFFVPHWHDSIDMGIPCIIGPESFCLYHVLRRFTCRDERNPLKTLAKLYEDGHLACAISQNSLAEHTGMSDRSVRRHAQALLDFGWIRSRGRLSPTSATPVYLLGGLTSVSGKERVTDSFFADEWLLKAKKALTAHARKLLRDPDARYRDIEVPLRIAFIRAWATSGVVVTLKKSRTPTEAACDDEKQDMDPGVRDAEQSGTG